jgi:uncharacterized protein YndB with AHSA1/START domain
VKLDLNVTEYFAEPIDEVWHAITDSRMLALWFMENDFEARVGARFVLRRSDPSPSWRGWVECEVLELQKPTRMVWSWCDGSEDVGPTRVIFELRSEGKGTRLTLRHIGDEGDETAKMVRDRWPIKLQALASMLGGNT